MWNTFKPDDGRWYRWKLCGAEAYLRKTAHQWQSAFKTIPFYELRGLSCVPDHSAPPLDLSVASAWGAGERVSLRPYLATPYVATLRENARLFSGATASFVVDLPPLLKIECCPDVALAEAMPFTLSKTWFGADPAEGSLYFSLPKAVLPLANVTEERPAPLVRCAITLKNTAKTSFDLRYLVIQPKSLSIYTHEGRLIADSLELEYNGIDLKMTVREQRNAAYTLLTAGVKTDLGEEFIHWGVDIIKNLTRL
jgi:hypothetical protein